MDNLFCENDKNSKDDFFSQYNNHLNHHHFNNENNENVTPKYILQQNKEAFTQKDLNEYDEMVGGNYNPNIPRGIGNFGDLETIQRYFTEGFKNIECYGKFGANEELYTGDESGNDSGVKHFKFKEDNTMYKAVKGDGKVPDDDNKFISSILSFLNDNKEQLQQLQKNISNYVFTHNDELEKLKLITNAIFIHSIDNYVWFCVADLGDALYNLEKMCTPSTNPNSEALSLFNQKLKEHFLTLEGDEPEDTLKIKQHDVVSKLLGNECTTPFKIICYSCFLFKKNDSGEYESVYSMRELKKANSDGEMLEKFDTVFRNWLCDKQKLNSSIYSDYFNGMFYYPSTMGCVVKYEFQHPCSVNVKPPIMAYQLHNVRLIASRLQQYDDYFANVTLEIILTYYQNKQVWIYSKNKQLKSYRHYLETDPRSNFKFLGINTRWFNDEEVKRYNLYKELVKYNFLIDELKSESNLKSKLESYNKIKNFLTYTKENLQTFLNFREISRWSLERLLHSFKKIYYNLLQQSIPNGTSVPLTPEQLIQMTEKDIEICKKYIDSSNIQEEYEMDFEYNRQLYLAFNSEKMPTLRHWGGSTTSTLIQQFERFKELNGLPQEDIISKYIANKETPEIDENTLVQTSHLLYPTLIKRFGLSKKFWPDEEASMNKLDPFMGSFPNYDELLSFLAKLKIVRIHRDFKNYFVLIAVQMEDVPIIEDVEPPIEHVFHIELGIRHVVFRDTNFKSNKQKHQEFRNIYKFDLVQQFCPYSVKITDISEGFKSDDGLEGLKSIVKSDTESEDIAKIVTIANKTQSNQILLKYAIIPVLYFLQKPVSNLVEFKNKVLSDESLYKSFINYPMAFVRFWFGLDKYIYNLFIYKKLDYLMITDDREYIFIPAGDKYLDDDGLDKFIRYLDKDITSTDEDLKYLKRMRGLCWKIPHQFKKMFPRRSDGKIVPILWFGYDENGSQLVDNYLHSKLQELYYFKLFWNVLNDIHPPESLKELTPESLQGLTPESLQGLIPESTSKQIIQLWLNIPHGVYTNIKKDLAVDYLSALEYKSTDVTELQNVYLSVSRITTMPPFNLGNLQLFTCHTLNPGISSLVHLRIGNFDKMDYFTDDKIISINEHELHTTFLTTSSFLQNISTLIDIHRSYTYNELFIAYIMAYKFIKYN